MRSRLAAGVAMVLVLTACGGGGGDGAAPTTSVALGTSTIAPTTLAPTTTIPATAGHMVALAKGSSVEIFTSTVQPEPTKVLESPQPSGAAPGGFYDLRMLVLEEKDTWLKVLLPVRPNGSSGWVRRSAVTVDTLAYRAVVQLGAHQITVWKGNEVVLQEPVGVGTSETPTPKGLFYTIETYPVLPNQQVAYGPWAIALSAYSEVLFSFGDGGTGVIGLHGTGVPSTIGRDVSNGCIRMSNSGITKLADMLPLGTPVEITA